MTTQPLVLLAEEEGASSSAVSVVDTLLDVAVYALLLGVVVLTLYSLYVTLDQRNKEYGGWVKKEDDELLDTSARGPNDRLRSGAVYDPVTEQWTYPAKTTKAAARVGRAPAADEEVGGNRYERRMEKKLKAAREGKKRRN